MHANALSTPNPVPWWCLLSACAAPVTLVSTAVAASPLRGPRYSPLSETLSSLAAAGPGHWVMTAVFVTVATCTYVTAWGLRVVPIFARMVLAVSATCGIALAVFTGDITESVSVHIVAVVTGSALLVAWPLLVISEDGAACRARRTRCSIAACGMLVVLSVWMLLEAHGGELIGLAERAAVVAQFAWPAVVAIGAHLREGPPDVHDLLHRYRSRSHTMRPVTPNATL